MFKRRLFAILLLCPFFAHDLLPKDPPAQVIVWSGDLESISATEVVVRVGGKVQSLNRNQVKRITLAEREGSNR